MRGKRLGWLICFAMIIQEAVAAPAQWAYRISFTDKAGAPAITSPNSFLSARALLRRSQQGIAVSEQDRPVSPAYIDSVLRSSGGKLHCTSRWFNQCVLLVTDTTGIASIRSKPFVTGVLQVGYFANGLHKELPGAAEPGGTPGGAANKGTGTQAYYGNTWAQTTMINGDYLHDNGLTGAGQLIAVLDLGFNGTNTHPGFDSLRSQGRILDQYNFVSATSNIYNTVWDHGTSSLSTMAGLAPGIFVGSAPRAQYALYITDDNSVTDALYELDNFVAGLERADSIGADIVTSSLGYNTFVNPAPLVHDFTKAQLDGHTTIVAKAMNMAVARGIFAVNSAGNEGGNAWNFLLSPSDADSVLTVGAVRPDRTIASFSGPGPNSSGRIKPDVCLLGDPAAVFSATSYSSSSGTSFSTPQIAGWAACIRQARPSITPYELRSAITRSADRANNPDAPGGYGYGIPDFRKVLQYVGVQELPGVASRITVAPNPFRGQISIQVQALKAATLSCTLYDMTGKVIATQRYTLQQGAQQFDFRLPQQVPAGNYVLQATAGGQTTAYLLSGQ